MSHTPSPTPLAAFATSTRTALIKIKHWWSNHGNSVIFYTYMAFVCALMVFLMKPYFG